VEKSGGMASGKLGIAASLDSNHTPVHLADRLVHIRTPSSPAVDDGYNVRRLAWLSPHLESDFVDEIA
jgi:hypothetical protein